MAAFDRYNANYLHLFYEDYLDKGTSGNFNPYSEVWKAKERIKTQALAKARSIRASSSPALTKIEELYNLSEEDFLSSKQESTFKSNQIQANHAMATFDQAISELKKLIKQDVSEISQALDLYNDLVRSVDEVLLMGAKTGGLAAPAMQQIQSTMDRRFGEIYNCLKAEWCGNKGAQKDLINMLTDIQGNISGYMMEIADVWTFLAANSKELKEIINIGGAVKSKDLSIKVDPKLIEQYEEIQAALAENGGQQSRVDNILVINGQENGTLTDTYSYVGLQEKNYTDISRVKIGDYTLGQLGINNYYTNNFLANTAGGLAGVRLQKAKHLLNYRTHSNGGESTLSQSYVDELWANIKDSVKILGVVDLFAANERQNIANKIDYYVVRQKGTGRTRLIPTGEVLQNRLQAYLAGSATDRIKFIANSNTNRERYWSINYTNFVQEEGKMTRNEAAIIRSNKAYGAIINEIMKTKIKISINFTNWF